MPQELTPEARKAGDPQWFQGHLVNSPSGGPLIQLSRFLLFFYCGELSLQSHVTSLLSQAAANYSSEKNVSISQIQILSYSNLEVNQASQQMQNNAGSRSLASQANLSSRLRQDSVLVKTTILKLEILSFLLTCRRYASPCSRC